MVIMNIATTNGVSQMKNIDAQLRSSNCPDQASRGSAVNELQDVLCTRLPSLHRRANRLLCNTADAEDAVQDALLSADMHLEQFEGRAQISTWLNAIVNNSARTHLRTRRRYVHVSLNEPAGNAVGLFRSGC
jgi:DNA-directed RNA polymerase specialized sigma24 family protein